MRNFEKSAIGLIFSALFFVSLILGTLYFQILNSSYLFSVFEKHKVYEKLPYLLATSIPNDPNLNFEERFVYSAVLSNIPPSLFKEIIEGNLSQALDFVHGQRENIEILLPTKQLGLGPADVRWSISENANPVLQERLKFVHGIATKILVLLTLALLGLVGLFLLYGKVANSKYKIGGYVLLLANGIALLLSSLIVKFFLIQMARDLPNQPEPAQKLLGLLAGSLFSEIIFSWIIIGILVTSAGCVLYAVVNLKLPRA